MKQISPKIYQFTEQLINLLTLLKSEFYQYEEEYQRIVSKQNQNLNQNKIKTTETLFDLHFELFKRTEYLLQFENETKHSLIQFTNEIEHLFSDLKYKYIEIVNRNNELIQQLTNENKQFNNSNPHW